MNANHVTFAVQRVIDMLERIPHSVIALAARFGIAGVFWQSARTKVDGWAITDTTYLLFREEYALPVIPSDIAALLATVSEHAFSVLLVVGLATRISAAALLGMTLVIQIFVYPLAWPTHLVWATCLIFLLGRGPGVVSVDALIKRRTADHGALSYR